MNFAAKSMISADKLLGWDKLAFVLLAFACAAVIAFAATPLAKKIAYKLRIIDVPKDERRTFQPLCKGRREIQKI